MPKKELDMSKTVKVGTGTSSGSRNLKAEVTAAKELGELVIVNPAKLSEEGTTGVVAKGVYEKAEQNKFNAAKKDYFLRNSNGTLYIVRESQSIKEQMELAEVGMELTITYNGKIATKSGRGMHDFEITAAS